LINNGHQFSLYGLLTLPPINSLVYLPVHNYSQELKMNEVVRRLKGANMDIDLDTPQAEIAWQQDACPWNAAENSHAHRCAVKNVSICRYFCGVEYLDTVLCCYPNPNPFQRQG